MAQTDSNPSSAPNRRPVPRSAPSAGSRSGWITLAIVALTFLAMRLMSPNPEKTAELSQAEFRAAVEAHEVERVERVRELDSSVTYLQGQLRGQSKPFRVRLVPGENEKLMDFLLEQGISCPVREKESLWGPILMQLLPFLLLAAFFWFVFYRKLGGAGGPLAFGKSKAKLLNEDKGKKRITFSDVAGVDEAKEEVQEIIEFLKAPAKFKKLGGRIPKGVLLVGPPGTGKTLLAKAIAGEAAVPFFSISGSDFEEMFVGVGASRVRDMFEQGKKSAPCLIFIDEIDAVGQKRGSTTTFSGSHAVDQTLNAMLVEMDGFDANEGVIIIAATNRPDVLDPALLRPGRFDRQIFVDLPTLKGREDILKLHGKKITFAPDADLARIARGTPGFSGADLANLLNEAALLAARNGLDGVTHAMLEEARDKVLWGRERKSANLSAKDRETTAWHESGHALLQLLLEHTDPLHKVTIIPRGRALGSTMSLPEQDILNRTKSYFSDELVVCAGGRVAEEMFTGDISTGAAQDIAEATHIARNMVCRFGMSGEFGFQAFLEPNQFSAAELPPPYSQKTAEAIDAEVQKLVTDAYEKARRLLGENRDKLERLAKALLEKESMDGRDVEDLVDIHKKHEEAPVSEEPAETPTNPAEAVPEETAEAEAGAVVEAAAEVVAKAVAEASAEKTEDSGNAQ